jgi:hypothetical protein
MTVLHMPSDTVRKMCCAFVIKSMRLYLFCCILALVGCSLKQSITAPTEALHVIAMPDATTNQLLQALKLLRDSKITNEPPQFWTAIANNSKYSVDHRRRAVLQLLARHFHPGMTFGEIGQLFDHATWIDRRSLGGGPAGNLPEGANETDGLAFVCISCGHDRAPVVWFRFGDRYTGSANDLYWCMEGKPTNSELARVRIVGIISQEDIAGRGLTFNAWGIPP